MERHYGRGIYSLIFVIAEIVRRTFLFQAYDPDTLRFLSAGPVYKVIVVRINKKEKSGKAGERKKSMYVSRVEGIRRRLNGLSPVARTIYDGRVWVDCGATIPLGYLSASIKTLPP